MIKFVELTAVEFNYGKPSAVVSVNHPIIVNASEIVVMRRMDGKYYQEYVDLLDQSDVFQFNDNIELPTTWFATARLREGTFKRGSLLGSENKLDQTPLHWWLTKKVFNDLMYCGGD